MSLPPGPDPAPPAPTAPSGDVSGEWTPRQDWVVATTRRLFPGVLDVTRWRPLICPFERLVQAIPPAARVLDVGCGSGLLLLLAAEAGRLATGLGFDASARAIANAQAAAGRLVQTHSDLRFCHWDATTSWPDTDADCVCMIDVLHHVRPALQGHVLAQAIARVPVGGRLVYKDMARSPWLLTQANRLHDLVMTQQWIHTLPLDAVQQAMEAGGSRVVAVERHRRWWYQHELLVGERV